MRTAGYIRKAIHAVRTRLAPTGDEEKNLEYSYFREICEGRIEEFLSKGYKRRHFFPHRIHYVPKCGPDGFKLALQMCGISDPNKHWEVVLNATSPFIDEFPRELFFDNDIVWHQQQLGRAGHICTSNLVVDGNNLYSTVHVSDIVQRISRRREFKTRIEKKFDGWPHMLFNSIMNFAIENNMRTVYSPTSDWALRHTDPKRTVQRELFERVYDRALNRQFRTTQKRKWWTIDVVKNKDRIVVPQKKQELVSHEKTICLCHDIEREFGHVDAEPHFAKEAQRNSAKNLGLMLSIEREMNVRATYNVLGCLLDQVRTRIEQDGHCVAFHSYDHGTDGSQLDRCRQVDYRIKGYRPPLSIITGELSDENLCFHNFEWLASSASSLRMSLPKMQNGIIKIPISFDDFPLHDGRMSYREWSQMGIDRIRENDFVAFCLHDCYADYWLPHYREFLTSIKGLGKLRTLDEVAVVVMLQSCT